MDHSPLQRELQRADLIPADEHRTHEDVGRFALAVFDKELYSANRTECDFLTYLLDPSHCSAPFSFGEFLVSTAYARRIEFRAHEVQNLTIEVMLLELSAQSVDKFEDDFWTSIEATAKQIPVLGALIEFSKHAQLSYWVASLADPNSIQIPEEGYLNCNGPLVVHETRYKALHHVLPAGLTQSGEHFWR